MAKVDALSESLETLKTKVATTYVEKSAFHIYDKALRKSFDNNFCTLLTYTTKIEPCIEFVNKIQDS